MEFIFNAKDPSVELQLAVLKLWEAVNQGNEGGCLPTTAVHALVQGWSKSSVSNCLHYLCKKGYLKDIRYGSKAKGRCYFYFLQEAGKKHKRDLEILIRQADKYKNINPISLREDTMFQKVEKMLEVFKVKKPDYELGLILMDYTFKAVPSGLSYKLQKGMVVWIRNNNGRFEKGALAGPFEETNGFKGWVFKDKRGQEYLVEKGTPVAISKDLLKR